MYIKKNSILHGINFHHFYDNDIYLKGQGALNKNHLRKLIKYIGRENIISPDDFIYQIQNKKFNLKKVCFTFDDGLRCQYEIAKSVLDEYKIKAFFFCFTSIFTNKPDLLELYRYFRIKHYPNMNNFYLDFFKKFENFSNYKVDNIFIKNEQSINSQKKIYKFHSKEDLLFRLIRDKYCEKKIYEKIMFQLFKTKNFSTKKFLKKLYLSENHVKTLSKSGHKIGAHSHMHYTNMASQSYDIQLKDYKKSLKILSKIIDNNIDCISHPCGSYNNNTVKVLKMLNVKYGFDSYLNNKENLNYYNYIIPRQDHANIFRKMKINLD